MQDSFADVTLSRERCSMARALNLLADRWLLLILREAFFGAKRFDAFQERLDISRSVLSRRLERLTETNLLRKRPYEEAGQRTRHEYLLTERGADLLPVLAALMEWGDRHETAPGGPPVRLVEADERDPVRLAFVRRDDGKEVNAADVRAELRNSGEAA